MSIFDRKDSVMNKQGKIEHLKNLIMLSIRDNQVHPLKLELITTFMQRRGLNDNDFQSAILDLIADKKIEIQDGRVKLKVTNLCYFKPKDKDEALSYLNEIIILMMVGGGINNKEKSMCYKLAKEFGVNQLVVDLQIINLWPKIKELYSTNEANTEKDINNQNADLPF
jgi:hypothetical protein